MIRVQGLTDQYDPISWEAYAQRLSAPGRLEFRHIFLTMSVERRLLDVFGRAWVDAYKDGAIAKVAAFLGDT